MIILLNDVGDGLFMEIETIEKQLLITDFGSQQIMTLQLDKFKRYLFEGTEINFALTHFHKDHYSGLVQLKEKAIPTNFSNVYIPRLPKVPAAANVLYALLAFNYYTMGDHSGSMEYDFISLLKKTNKKSFTIIPVSRGDIISLGSTDFTVSWPPRNIDNRLGGSLAKIVKAFEMEIENMPQLRELYKRLRDDIPLEIFTGNEATIQTDNKWSNWNEEYSNEKVKGRIDGIDPDFKVPKAHTASLSSINKSLRNAANSLSLAYFNDDINFLGDLNKRQIGDCITYMITQNKFHGSRIIVYPHHGTHWNELMLKIKSGIGLSSTGRKMIIHWQERNKEVAPLNLSTYEVRTIILRLRDDEITIG